MWEFASYLYPESRSAFQEIQSAAQLPEVAHPFPPPISIAKRGQIEEYLSKGKLQKKLHKTKHIN